MFTATLGVSLTDWDNTLWTWSG